jgi:hypothetical protein
VADQLRHALIDDIKLSGDESKAAITRTIWGGRVRDGVGAGAGRHHAVLLPGVDVPPDPRAAGGVQRVHAGDFDQPIALDSGDELQELATS